MTDRKKSRWGGGGGGWGGRRTGGGGGRGGRRDNRGPQGPPQANVVPASTCPIVNMLWRDPINMLVLPRTSGQNGLLATTVSTRPNNFRRQ